MMFIKKYYKCSIKDCLAVSINVEQTTKIQNENKKLIRVVKLDFEKNGDLVKIGREVVWNHKVTVKVLQIKGNIIRHRKHL